MDEVTNVDSDYVQSSEFYLSLRLNCLKKIRSILEHGLTESNNDKILKDQSLINVIFDLLDLNGDGLIKPCIGKISGTELQENSTRESTTDLKDVIRDKYQRLFRRMEKGMNKKDFTKLWTHQGFQGLLMEHVHENLAYDVQGVTEMLIWITNPRMLSKDMLARLNLIHQRLCQVAVPGSGVSLVGFRSILTANHPWLIDRLFVRLKKDWNGGILSADDVQIIFLHVLGQEYETKTFFLFSLFDDTCEGRLTCADLKQVLADCMRDNGVVFEEEEQRQLVQVLVQECLGVKGVTTDCSKEVSIEYQDIRNLLNHEQDLAPTIALSLDLWLAPLIATKPRSCIQNVIPYNLIRNNIQQISAVIILIVALILLFTIRGAQFKDAKNIDGTTCWIIIIARGCGSKT